VSRQGWIIASASCLALFLLLVLVQKPLEAEYDPLRQGISEFVHTDAERLAQLAFLAWASSLAILSALLVTASAPPNQKRALVLEVIGVGVAVAGLLLVTCFATDRGAEVAGEVTRTTTGGGTHDIGSALVALGISLAVLASGARWQDFRLAGAVFSAAFISSLILFVLGDPLPGLRQRCLVAAACLWQAVSLWQLWREGSTSDRSSAGSRCSTS
jgi:hypothetical protein